MKSKFVLLLAASVLVAAPMTASAQKGTTAAGTMTTATPAKASASTSTQAGAVGNQDPGGCRTKAPATTHTKAKVHATGGMGTATTGNTASPC